MTIAIIFYFLDAYAEYLKKLELFLTTSILENKYSWRNIWTMAVGVVDRASTIITQIIDFIREKHKRPDLTDYLVFS